MSTSDLIAAVLKKVPQADVSTVLDLIVSCDADLNRVFALLGVQSASRKRQMTFDAHTTRLPAKVGKTSADVVYLYTKEQVEDADICCSMHPDFLDPSVANKLAMDLEAESASWNRRKFHLFEREVTSGYSSWLFSSNDEVLSGSKTLSYQGGSLKPQSMHRMPPAMVQARDKIEELVRKVSPDWHSELCVANRFAGREEKLDYHSDQLTHLGPRPIIAALTLGCAREFRIKDRSVPPRRPVYSIRIPHNCVLIMHAGCQERFKHCVPPATSLDPDPLMGTTRISLTFRHYRDITPPKCQCNVPMLMRSTLPDAKGAYKYIWQCAAGYLGEPGCSETRKYDPMVADR